MSTHNTSVTPQLERIFLHWILKNNHFFKVVEGNYFKNEDIKFIYNIIRNEWFLSTDKSIPSAKEIKVLVKSSDKDDKISNDLLNTILKHDSADYREEFVDKRFKAWILSNSTLTGLVDAIEAIKNVDKINYDDVLSSVQKVKNIMTDKTTVDLGDNNIGIDFDDPDAHNQETDVYKLDTGYTCLNTMLGGGFDRKTLNIYIGAPGSGKCSFSSTLVTIRNKITDRIENITMEDFFKITIDNIKYENLMYDKFIESNIISDYEVLTPNNWINVEGIGKTVEFDEWIVETVDGKKLICADTHILGRCDNIDWDKKTYDLTEICCKDLKSGDFVMTIDGPDVVLKIEKTDKKSNMYDLQLSDGSNKHYYTNGFLSHNSIWLNNFSVNAANNGYNVLYVTLELAEKKVLKRIGSMRLNIDISEYTELAKDREFIKNKIEEVNRSLNKGGVFDQKIGKIWIKEFPSGSATVNDIENVVKLIHEQTGKNIDLLIVDYIQIMKAEKALQIDNMLYLKGKHLAEGLRSIAQRYMLTVITATQVAKEKYAANDVNLNDMPESKAIADTADTVFAIIRTPPMKIEGKYQLKQLKLRDSDCEYERIGFNFNKKTLKIENDDYFIENAL